MAVATAVAMAVATVVAVGLSKPGGTATLEAL
jgi:hypothetical protein